MDYISYETIVKSSFDNIKKEKLSDFDVLMTYEEFFKWEWLATKQKVFSFTAYSEDVTIEQIKKFAELSYAYCKENYRGLPRGFQTGFMSFTVLVCQKVDEDAIKYVENEAHIHFAAVEIPMVYDLEKERLYSLKKHPMCGSMYNKFKKEYIREHFQV